ncbi:hypothetical protein Btru_014494, partial [Bulinus truncatus]
YGKLLAAFNVLDLVLTLVIPVLLVSGLMLLTLVAVVQGAKRQNRLNGIQRTVSLEVKVEWRDKLSKKAIVLHFPCRRDEDRFQSAEAKVAKFLTIVSLTLLFLHSPSHVIRLKLLIASMAGSTDVSDSDPALQRAFEVMYYINFSANLAIYALAGENFRKTFWSTFRCKSCAPMGGSWNTLRMSGRKVCLERNSSAVNLEFTLVYSTYENSSFLNDGHELGTSSTNLIVMHSPHEMSSSASCITMV